MALVNRRALSTLQKLTVAVILVAVISGVAYSLGLFNRPPKAAFTYRTPTRTLKYIAPTDRDLIIFQNESTDPETPLEKLICNWYVRFNATGDWKLLNSSTHHQGRLPASNEKGNEIKLVVSNGMKEDSVAAFLPVDLAYLSQYAKMRLNVSLKGINYIIGMKAWSTLPVSDEEMKESLIVIGETGCNAVRIVGDDGERIIKCAQLCLGVFDTILLSPFFRDMTLEDVKSQLSRMSRDAEILRAGSDRIILVVGNELSYEMRDIVPGQTYGDRVAAVGNQKGLTRDQISKLNMVLKALVSEAVQYFKGRIAYASLLTVEGPYVDWDGIGLHVAAPHAYFETSWMTSESYQRMVGWYRKTLPGKLVLISEFGYFTFEDAMKWGASGSEYAKTNPVTYSQKAQADALKTNLHLINRTNVDGIFLWDFMEKKSDDINTPSIIKYDKKEMWRRKLSFYAYQSFIST